MASLVSLNQSTCLQHSSRMPLKHTYPSVSVFKACSPWRQSSPQTNGKKQPQMQIIHSQVINQRRNSHYRFATSLDRTSPKKHIPHFEESWVHPSSVMHSIERYHEMRNGLFSTMVTEQQSKKTIQHKVQAINHQGWSHQSNMLSSKPKGLTYGKICSNILSVMNMNAAQPDENGKSSIDLLIDKARKLWDSSPQEVKCFPWTRALENFTQLIIDIILLVTQFLYVPVMAITSVSEMSYSAHERKLFITPLPLLIGVAVAGVLRSRALKISPFLKDAKVPWHLYANMLFFTLIKLPGPYYPYWGRILIPHFANGGLFRTLWFLFLWYRMPRKDVRTDLGHKA